MLFDLPSVLDHSCHKLPILHNGLQHFGDRMFSEDTLFLPFGYADVNRAALGRRDLGVEAGLGQEDLA